MKFLIFIGCISMATIFNATVVILTHPFVALILCLAVIIVLPYVIEALWNKWDDRKAVKEIKEEASKHSNHPSSKQESSKTSNKNQSASHSQKVIQKQKNKSDESEEEYMFDYEKFKCPKCGKFVYYGETECKNCGEKFDIE